MVMQSLSELCSGKITRFRLLFGCPLFFSFFFSFFFFFFRRAAGQRTALAANHTEALCCLHVLGCWESPRIFFFARRAQCSSGKRCGVQSKPAQTDSRRQSHAVVIGLTTEWGLLLWPSNLACRFSFLFALVVGWVGGRSKRFTCSTAGLRELLAPPDLLRQVRLEFGAAELLPWPACNFNYLQSNHMFPCRG